MKFLEKNLEMNYKYEEWLTLKVFKHSYLSLKFANSEQHEQLTQHIAMINFKNQIKG